MQQAIAQHQLGNLVEAVRLYKLVLRKQPRHFDALHLLGLAEAQRGRPAKAEELMRKALTINAGIAEVQSNLANVLQQLGRLAESLEHYDHALRLQPTHLYALNNKGNVLLALGRQSEAIASFDAAIAIEPQFAGAHYNRGVALRALGDHERAFESLSKAATLDPNSPAIHTDRGSALVALGRIEEALAAFDRAITLAPDFTDAWYDRGVALLHLERFEEALVDFDRALAANPHFAQAHGNRGNVLFKLGRIDEALTSFDRAIEADPNFLSALADKGRVALTGSRYQVAAETFERLVARDGEHPYALGNLLFARAHCCDWQAFEVLRSLVGEGVRDGKRTALPGPLMALTHAPDEQLRAARVFVADAYPGALARRASRGYRHDKIRLAYLSANFHEHAMPVLLAGMFEHHDRTRFETTAISFGADDAGAMRARLVGAFDRFVDVSEQSDRQVAELVESLQIDIAIDLMGFTQAARPGIFLPRPAEIQASYMGFAATTGLDCLDYIIADACVIPEEHKSAYSEQVVHLPDSYYANDNTRPISKTTPTRLEAGLPAQGFVFCCFNNNFKITPDVFAIWMRLLGAIEGSVLWLLRPNATAERNLREAAQAHGIAPERLVFAERTTPAEHLARHRLADLFVDTLPYNAHTTACDALWAGLPLVTRMGQTFASRVAASVLRAVGLPELVTETASDYEALALRLARTPDELAALKAKLARNRLTYPLFDTDRFRRHMETAYVTMWEKHQRGEPPAGFSVPPISPPAR